MTITIAVTPTELSTLDAALDDGETITIATQLTADTYGIQLQMTETQALEGTVRAGDIVNVLRVIESGGRRLDPVLLASNIEVLNVSSTLGDDAASTFAVLVAANPEQLLTLTTATLIGEVSLTNQ